MANRGDLHGRAQSPTSTSWQDLRTGSGAGLLWRVHAGPRALDHHRGGRHALWGEDRPGTRGVTPCRRRTWPPGGLAGLTDGDVVFVEVFLDLGGRQLQSAEFRQVGT